MKQAIVCSLFLITAATALQAAGPAVSVEPSGEVWSNSQALAGAATARSGDSIRTAAGKAVMKSAALGRIEVRDHSRVRLAEEHVELEEGAVVSSSAPVRLKGFTVRPKDPAADRNLFAVASRGGKQLIAAHRGDVVVTGAGAAPLLVPAGAYAMPPRTTPEEEDEDEDRREAGGTPGAAADTGWTIGSLSHGKSVALVAGIGAAAVGGTVAALAISDDDDEPVRTPTQ